MRVRYPPPAPARKGGRPRITYRPAVPSDFDLLVSDAIDALPREFRELLENTPVVVSSRGHEYRAYGHYWGDTVGVEDSRYLFCVANMALDLYGLGDYAAALELQERTYPRFREVLGIGHIIVCGHSQRGAMQALLSPQPLEDLPAARAFFGHAESTRRIVQQNDHLPNEFIQLNHFTFRRISPV